MTDRWIDTDADLAATERASDFWTVLREDLDAGAFWADRIKQYRGDPARRLRTALDNLPLPAAFREAAIATRALIREKRRNEEPYEEELACLYWLAAIRSFMLAYSERLKEPGFNIMESIPGKRVRSLAFTYAKLGTEKLALLNKTDRKWMREAWGEPDTHTTLNAMHQDVWSEYEEKLVATRERERRDFEAHIQSLM